MAEYIYEYKYGDGYASAGVKQKLVRCKDCRYYSPNLIDEVTGLPMCGAWAAPQKPEGYCNYGAIMDEVEE